MIFASPDRPRTPPRSGLLCLWPANHVRPQRFYEVLMISIAPKSSGNPRGSRHRSASLSINEDHDVEMPANIGSMRFVYPMAGSIDRKRSFAAFH
jgi:hypothetical protein